MAKFVIPPIVSVLVPEAIMDRVQNGLDTSFTEALDEEATSAWKSRVKAGTSEKPASVVIRNTLKRKWQVAKDAPGLFLHFCIQIGNAANDVGEFSVTLPECASAWFARLEAKAKHEAEVAAKLAADKAAKEAAENS